MEQRPQPMGMPKGDERQHDNILGYLIFAPKLIHWADHWTCNREPDVGPLHLTMVEETDKFDHFHHSVVCSLLTQNNTSPSLESCTRSKGKPVADKYKVAQIQQHQVLLGCHFRSCCVPWGYHAQCLKIRLLLFMENKRWGDLVDLGIV